MISERMNKIVSSLWMSYNNIIKKIPQISDIVSSNNNGFWAEFMIEDLYNKKYTLYIFSDLEKMPYEFIEQILFHEFTHLADSLDFLKYKYDDFVSVMNIYSETHASEIQMDRMLLTQTTRPWSLDNNVIHGGILSLNSFMKQTFNHLENEFCVPKERITINNLKYDQKNLYYFTGYLISLSKHNIKFNWKFQNTDIYFIPIFTEIIELLLSGDYDIQSIIQLNNHLIQMIKDKIYNHNKIYNELRLEEIRKKLFKDT